jgi:TPP-dependent pyruvate/acetoin dehydrogenase alpha subunit
MSPDELIAFEQDIASEYNAGNIKAPIHLSGGNEQQLIDVFKDFRLGDYVFSTWRSHYHALLAGVPPEKVEAQIMAGRSMTLCWPEHRFFSSAIVAGCCPIAVGVGWQIKQASGNEHVYCFLGDMATLTGLATECMRYARWHELPVRFVIEDNGKSVCTDTKQTWNIENIPAYGAYRYYKYDLTWPHSGAGKRINF